MPLQTFDFGRLPILDKPYATKDYSYLSNLLPSVLEGYKMSRTPLEIAQKEQERELANKLSGIKAEYLPREYEANILGQELLNQERKLGMPYVSSTAQEDLRAKQLANQIAEKYGMSSKEADILYKNAMAKKAQQSADLGGITPTGKLGQAIQLYRIGQMYGKDHPLTKAAQSAYDLEEQRVTSNIDRQKAITASQNFKSLPKEAKENVLAAWRSIGVDETEAVPLINQGILASDYAVENLGYSAEDAENLDKKYAATTKTISDIQQVEGAAAEEEFLGKKIDDAMSPYSRQFFGYSPEQIIESFSNDPKLVDKQAKYLAARALAPEKALLQIRMSGGSSANAAIHEIMERVQANGKIFGPNVSPEVRKKMGQYAHEWLQEAVKRRVSAMKGQKNKEQNYLNQSLDKLSPQNVQKEQEREYEIIKGKEYFLQDGEWYER